MFESAIFIISPTTYSGMCVKSHRDSYKVIYDLYYCIYMIYYMPFT